MEDLVEFLRAHHNQILDRRATYDAHVKQVDEMLLLCGHALETKSLSYLKGTIPLDEVIRCCEQLMKYPTPSNAAFGERVGDLVASMRGKAVCIGRSYGLGQDGIFLLPVDWYR